MENSYLKDKSTNKEKTIYLGFLILSPTRFPRGIGASRRLSRMVLAFPKLVLPTFIRPAPADVRTLNLEVGAVPDFPNGVGSL